MKTPRPISLVLTAVAAVTVLRLIAQAPPVPDPSVGLAQTVAPFIRNNCQTCHNTALPSGGVDLQQLLATPNSLAVRHDTWENVVSQIRSGAMPPVGAAKPAKADADAAL